MKTINGATHYKELLERIVARGYELKFTRDIAGNPLSFRVQLFDPETTCYSVFIFDPVRKEMAGLTDDEMMTYILQKLLKTMERERKLKLMSAFKKENNNA